MDVFMRCLVLLSTAGSLVTLTWSLALAQACPPECGSGTVPLGMSAPTSGTAAAFGQTVVKAVQVAVGEINAVGGLMGVPVKLLVGDDRCDAGNAVRVAKQHIEQDKIGFVIGPTCPAVAMDAAPLYAKAGVIQFVPTVTMVGLTQRYPDNIFRLVATDQQEAQAIAAYLSTEQKGKKFAVVYSEFFYRSAMAGMIDGSLSAEQKALGHIESLPDVTGAYDRLADKLQKNPPDVIYMSLDSEQVVEFVGKLRQRNIKSILVGGQHLLASGFWRSSKAVAEGINVIAPIASLNNPEVHKAVDLLKKGDVVPDIVTAAHFAAVQVWAEAVRRAGGGDPKEVLKELRKGEFETAVGSVAFDEKGDRRNIQYSLLTWKDGHLVPGAKWRH